MNLNACSAGVAPVTAVNKCGHCADTSEGLAVHYSTGAGGPKPVRTGTKRLGTAYIGGGDLSGEGRYVRHAYSTRWWGT